MSTNDFLSEPTTDLDLRLTAMTDDEVFSAMAILERASEKAENEERDEVLSRIALVEGEIERRFPGEVLAPYRDWKKAQPMLPA